MAPLTAILDACVLYSAPLRDFLLRLAREELYRARWTDQIHDEWVSAIQRNRPDIPRERINSLREVMNRAVPDCLVTGYERRIDVLELPDQNDRHVLAAAIECGATIIVTMNLKDFPPSILGEYGIEALHPDDFICNLIDCDLDTVCVAAKKHRASLTSPPKTVSEFLDTLQDQGLDKTVCRLRENIDQI